MPVFLILLSKSKSIFSASFKRQRLKSSAGQFISSVPFKLSVQFGREKDGLVRAMRVHESSIEFWNKYLAWLIKNTGSLSVSCFFLIRLYSLFSEPATFNETWDTRCTEVSISVLEADFGNEKEFWVKEETRKKFRNFRWLFVRIDTAAAKASRRLWVCQ